MSQEPSPGPWRRAVRIGILSFFLAIVVSYLSDLSLSNVPALIAFLVVLVLIAMGIVFDILGTSVTAAEEAPLHAMAANKVVGSRQALWLVRNADKVANIANDVFGDVFSAVSGAASAVVATQLNNVFHGGAVAERITTLTMIGLIAGLTVGFKAAGKTFALTRANDVVFWTGRIVYGIERITGRSFTGGRKTNSSRRRTT